MKKYVLALALVVILIMALTALAQSDAGFLNGPYPQWWCLHQDGTNWVRTGLDNTYSYQDAVNWCAANGYSW